MSLLIRNARVLTLHLPGAIAGEPRRGAGLRELGIIPRGDVLVDDGKVAAVGAKVDAPPGAEVVDAGGRVLMPGFVDCHTHACWAGDRTDEWEKQMSGPPPAKGVATGVRPVTASDKRTPYGGRESGLMAAVTAVREATPKQLAANLKPRLDAMLRGGTTTVEVKSGFGLQTEAELKMLRAIRRAANEAPLTVVATALLGQALGGQVEESVKLVVKDMLAEISREFPDIPVEAVCTRDGWPVEACVRLFEKARKHHPIRVHADQFDSLGMLPEAIRLGARSADHLEAASKEDLLLLAQSRTCAVVLPGASFEANRRFARAGFLAESGGAVALATDCNPESPGHSMPLAIALAVRFTGLTVAEAIVAATVNAAAALGLADRGTIGPGQRADLILLHHKDERQLAFELGGNPVATVFCAGKVPTP